MMSKTMTALATAMILAITPAAQANDRDKDDVGGFHIGPLGQPMGYPYAWGANAPWSYYRGRGYRSYGYAPRGRAVRHWHYEP